jgi:3-oxoadipate enol-lactonase
MPSVKLGDINLYYEVEGEGEWAVFVHGGGGTHLSWWQQVYALRNRYKCLTYDARGSGQTEGTADSPNGDRELIALMDHLGIKKAFLNGWSAGGSAVAKVTQAHPDRVHALIMTCCVFGFQTPVLSKWAAEMLDKFSKGFMIGDHSRGKTFAERDPQAAYLSAAIGRLNERVRPPTSTAYTKRFGSAYEEMRDAKPVDYSKFNVPTLFVVGEQDELQVPWLVRGTAELVHGAKIVEIPDSGHGPPVEQSGIYNATLMTFMDRYDPRNPNRPGPSRAG